MSSPSQVNVGVSGGLRFQDGVPQTQEVSRLSIPEFNRFFEDSFVRMILRTSPCGHRPRFCSSATSTSSFYQTIIAKRGRLSHSVGGSGGLITQDSVSQQEEDVPLSLPQFNRLFEDSFVRD